jgi:anthranilate/para-aminobenzoate synthase component I
LSLSLQVRTRAATPAEAEAALARLDHTPGVYFGCDAGVPGLHPLQATLLTEPAVALSVFDDGADLQPLNAWGRALLAQPALAACVARAGRGEGHAAVAVARSFLAAFGRDPRVQLVGALGFEAYRLAQTGAAQTGRSVDGAALGTLFFAPRYWQRDADGGWHFITLDVQGIAASDGDAAHAAASAAEPLADAPEPRDDFPQGGYAEVVARAVQVLRAQPLVSLTLSQSFRRRIACTPSEGFARLRQANPAPASFFVNTGHAQCLFGASPDLQLVVHANGEVEALPVCGTVARQSGAVGEAESFRELINEEVDAASLAVCSDALGNDLAPLCVPGSLRLVDRRRPMALSTVVHTVDRLRGQLREGVDAWDAIVATAAPVMLTGTPRKLALAAIAQLEGSPRGWYGGMMVRVGADGSALVGTILRAACIRHGVAEVRTGGDLLADSDPPREERESRLKAISLWRALGLAPQVAPGVFGNAGTTAQPQQGPVPASAALCDGSDPLSATTSHVLRGLGVTLDARAALRVLIGADANACRQAMAGARGLVALGDAALRVLACTGMAVQACQPEHGRLLRCHPTPQAPWPDAQSFLSARYATLALAPGAEAALARAGWAVWAHDDAGRAVALAHADTRHVCLLFRPDSLLGDTGALVALREALRFAAQPRAHDAAAENCHG